jgi:hypothetical protein
LDPAAEGRILIGSVPGMAKHGVNTSSETANIGFRQRIDHTWFN